MAIELIVGDNTYTTLEEADAYFLRYGNADWAGDDDTKSQALILATQSVDLLYGARYLSIMESDTQILLFPRVTFMDRDGRTIVGIPTSLKNAVCEIALMQLSGIDIFPVANTDGQVKQDQIQVGELVVNKVFFQATTVVSYEGFNKVDVLLRPLLKSNHITWSITG